MHKVELKITVVYKKGPPIILLFNQRLKWDLASGETPEIQSSTLAVRKKWLTSEELKLDWHTEF